MGVNNVRGWLGEGCFCLKIKAKHWSYCFHVGWCSLVESKLRESRSFSIVHCLRTDLFKKTCRRKTAAVGLKLFVVEHQYTA